MLTRELQLYKARFGTKNAILSLVLRWQTPLHTLKAKNTDMATKKSTTEPEKDVEVVEEAEATAEEVGIHRVSNPVQAATHVQTLDRIMNDM